MQKLEPIDISVESRIVASIVSDTKLLDQCNDIIDPTLFESPTTQIVVEWALDYYRRLKQAPGANMKDVFAARRAELNDGDAELVYSYMKRGDWKPADNLDFAKKQVEEYIFTRSMNRLVERLRAKAESGNYKDCEKVIAEWKKPEIRQSKVIDLFMDVDGITDALNKEEDDVLLRFNGDLGRTVGNFVQSDYALWLAPAKRGKTWWLMYTALQAAFQGGKVLYISLEMTEDETRERFVQMITGRSREGEIAHITKFDQCGDERWEMLEGDVATQVMDKSKVGVEKSLSLVRKYSNGGTLKILTFPTNSLSVDDLKSELLKLETFDGFVPTMVVVDYVDIMKFNYGNEKRFGLDKLHLELRSLNMDRKFCLVSASQTGRGTVTGENDVDEASIAEAVSKLNHATKIILINQTKDEKKQGIYRINVNMSRHGGVSYETCVCASCLEIGRPVIDCHRLSHIYDPKKDQDGANELRHTTRRRRGYEEN